MRIQRFFSLRNYFFNTKKKKFGEYSIVKVGKVSPMNVVPEHIKTPSYYKTGRPLEKIDAPEIKTAAQIAKMRDSCRLAANILKEVGKTIHVGQSTNEIDLLVHRLSIENGAYPSPLNYKFFPKSVCTSVNNVACHGIPDDRPLQDGDIINVDITVFYNGYHGDCSKTFLVGNVDEAGKQLVQATETCCIEAISLCQPGRQFCDLGEYIEYRAGNLGYTVVPVFTGHGIGQYFHGPPDIYHIATSYPGRMVAGMTFTVEPILTQGEETIEILDDKWTAVTVDGARTAQHEHTILITSSGAEILTLPD